MTIRIMLAALAALLSTAGIAQAQTDTSGATTTPTYQALDLLGTFGVADAKRWRIRPFSADGGPLQICTVNDANVVGTCGIEIRRSGQNRNAVSSVRIGDSPTTTGTLTIGTYDATFRGAAAGVDTTMFISNTATGLQTSSRLQFTTENNSGNASRVDMFNWGVSTPDINLALGAFYGSASGYPTSANGAFVINAVPVGTATPSISIGTNNTERIFIDATSGLVHFDGSIGVGTSISQGGGLKHQRVGTGFIGAGASALVTLTWLSSFADANYTVNCTVEDATASASSLRLLHVESKSGRAVVARVSNTATRALAGSLGCIAMHD